VEILLNLVWVTLSVALSVLWLLRRVACNGDAHSISLKTQLVSLAVVLLILLPVVSITDDLQASIAPAEVEHACRRGDSIPGHDTTLQSQFAIVATWLIVLHVPNSFAVSSTSQSAEVLHPQSGFAHPLQSRPPPRAA
jgi:hypothetical protein